MSEKKVFEFDIQLNQINKYKFEVDFGEETVPNLLMDETKEIGGEGVGPSASMLLGASIGHCLAASLTFCLSKKKVEMTDLKVKVRLLRERNDEGYWRISAVYVILKPKIKNQVNEQFTRCVNIFRNYCIVSTSINDGIPINVEVKEE
ncbi:MAG: OsmC family protein [Candidatus Heimdallarchaeaceae archaeon]